MGSDSIEIALITFACPDCETGECYYISTFPYTFKCNKCSTEHFLSRESINFLKKTKLKSFSMENEARNIHTNNSVSY